MAGDALAPCIPKPSEAMVLTVYIRLVLDIYEEELHKHTASLKLRNDKNCECIFTFSKINWAQQG